MSPIQSDQNRSSRNKPSANLRRAERYLERARALMESDDSPQGWDTFEVARRNNRQLRAMAYAALAHAYAERSVIDHDKAAQKGRTNGNSLARPETRTG